MTDKISPRHYQLKVRLYDDTVVPVETINIISAVLEGTDTFNQFQSHCLATALAYLIRAPRKNGIEDIKKAKKYLEFLIEYYETVEVPFK